MTQNIYLVKEELETRVNEILLAGDRSSRTEILEAGLMHKALRSIQQLEKERDDAVDLIVAVEDVLYAAKSRTGQEESAVDRLSPLVNIAKIERALGRENA
jgi:hypothetical protein